MLYGSSQKNGTPGVKASELSLHRAALSQGKIPGVGAHDIDSTQLIEGGVSVIHRKELF